MSEHPSPPFEPDSSFGRIRNSVKGIVLRDGQILLTVNRDSQGLFHLLPGGGQKFGERLTDTLIREVREETGWTVKPGRLLLVRDYIAANHEFAEEEGDVHQIELMFLAEPLSHFPEDADLPDTWQVGVEWVDVDRLDSIRIYPSIMRVLLPDVLSSGHYGPIYLGDIN